MRRLVAVGLVASAAALAPHTHSRMQRAHVKEHAQPLMRRALGTAAVALALIMPSTAQAKELTDSQRFAAEAWRATDKLYYERTFGGADWFRARSDLLQQATDPESARGAVDSLLRKLGDPYTRYIDREKYDTLIASTLGDAAVVAGAGVQVIDGDNGKVVVVDVEPGAPADKAGLRAGDEIQQVGATTVKDAASTAQKLRGEEGSLVKVAYVRDGKDSTADISRAVVPLSTVRRDQSTIRIKAFQLDTATKVKESVEKVSGPLILDLRGNPGGSLEGGVETARLFLPKGAKITTVTAANGQPFAYDAVEDGAFSGRKLTVLVNKQTASAAEVLTAALQDNKAASVVGTDSRTYGKGVIQTVQPLGDPPGAEGAVAVTVARYATPSGGDLNGKGVAPDRVVACGVAERASSCAGR